MHSIYSRVNNVSALFSSCLMALVAAITLSTFVFTADPKGGLSVPSIKVSTANARRYPKQRQELAHVKFNVSADLTPLFNWNTKQLFIYLEAEYTNTDGVKNAVVIWDRIVRRKEDAIINVIGKNKYQLRSPTFKKVSPAHYFLKYNVMPYIGTLTYGEAGSTPHPIMFPKAR